MYKKKYIGILFVKKTFTCISEYKSNHCKIIKNNVRYYIDVLDFFYIYRITNRILIFYYCYIFTHTISKHRVEIKIK